MSHHISPPYHCNAARQAAGSHSPEAGHSSAHLRNSHNHRYIYSHNYDHGYILAAFTTTTTVTTTITITITRYLMTDARHQQMQGAAGEQGPSPAQLQAACLRLLGCMVEASLALGGQLRDSFSSAIWLWCRCGLPFALKQCPSQALLSAEMMKGNTSGLRPLNSHNSPLS